MTFRSLFGPAFSLRMTLAVTFLFALANALVRRIAGDSLAMDDAKTNVFTQVWQWGYQPDNPPLFEWLTKLLHIVTTGDLWSFLILKYLALIAAAGFVYGTVKTYADDREAFGTAVGMVLLYQIGWNFHQAFTHSALLLPAVAAMMWAGLAAFRRPTILRMAVLGVVTGIALLTKYNAALYVAGFVLAGLANSRIRAVILSPAFAIVPVVAAVVVWPHAIWFIEQSDAYRATLEGTMGLGGSYGARLGEGLYSLVVGVISFFLPWALFAARLACGRGLIWYSEERLLIRISVIALVMLVGAVIVFGIGNVSERYLIPVLLPAYVGMTGVILRAQKGLRCWLRPCLYTAAVFVALRLLTYLFPGPPCCEDCREFVPYDALEAPIGEAVPEGSILFVREENTGGNMVAQFPRSPVRVLTSFKLMGPIEDLGQRCYYVWSEDTVGGVPLSPVFDYAYTHPDTIMVDAPWSHPLKRPGYRRTVWGITPIEDPALYRHYCLGILN